MSQRIRNLLSKPELVFLLIGSVFGILSVFMMPILEAPDENQHFQVEYAMFSGNKRADKDLVLNEAMVLEAVHNGTYEYYFSDSTSADTDGIAFNTGLKVFDGKTKSSALDIMRLPQALGILFARIVHPTLGFMVVMGRLFGLAAYVASIYYIIKRIHFGKWVTLMIASTPIMIQQAASLSYDSMNLVVVFAWFAFIVNLYTQKQNASIKQFALGAILATLLFVSKPNNMLYLSLLAALPLKHILQFKQITKALNSTYGKYLKIIIVCLSVVALIVIGKMLFTRLLDGNEFDPLHLTKVLLTTFISGDLGLIDVTIIGVVGQFSNFYYHLPVWLIAVYFILLGLVLLWEKLPNVGRKFAYGSGALFIGSILIITIGMYYGWATKPFRFGPGALVADGIQGRYFTPLLVFLFPLFARLQRYVKVSTIRVYTMPLIILSASCIFLTVYILQTWNYFWN